MITNKDGKEIRLITLSDLCRYCMCNTHKHDLQNSPRFQSQICSNKVDESDGFTLNEKCPIWTNLQNVILLNV